MSRIERFEEIQAWQEARVLAREVNQVASQGPFARDFSLRDQIQRATVSVMSNIAEGYGAGSRKSFITFLRYAYRSTLEVQNQLYIGVDRSYISKEDFATLYEQAKKTRALIAGFIHYLQRLQ